MASDIKWIKIRTDIFDDEKIKLIDSLPERDCIFVIWIKLLSLAGKINNDGYIFISENFPYTEEMLSTIFNRPLNTIKLALQTFKKFNMIDISENQLIKITNWEKHQNIDGMTRIREQTRLRVEKYRQKITCNATVTENNALDKTRLDKTREDKIIDIYAPIFEHWNTKNIINHSILTEKMKIKIKSALKDYPETMILSAINNYAEVIAHPETYFFSYRWTLADFLQRGLSKFLTEAKPLENFLHRKKPEEIKKEALKTIEKKGTNPDPQSMTPWERQDYEIELEMKERRANGEVDIDIAGQCFNKKNKG